jgi:hypothetical protein
MYKYIVHKQLNIAPQTFYGYLIGSEAYQNIKNMVIQPEIVNQILLRLEPQVKKKVLKLATNAQKTAKRMLISGEIKHNGSNELFAFFLKANDALVEKLSKGAH